MPVDKKSADADRIGKGTGPLSWEKLSDSELATLIEIERRLYGVQAQAELRQNDKNGTDSSKDEALPPMAVPHNLYERAFLIDGGRGTGKSSLLQTFIERWTDEKKRNEIVIDEAYKKRVESLRVSHFVNAIRDTDIPDRKST